MPVSAGDLGPADRITENVMQLLFAAQQEIAEIGEPDNDHVLLASAHVHAAITGLRQIASELPS